MIATWLLGAWAGQAITPSLWLRRAPHLADHQPELALTFDDGPDPVTTPQVLEILDHYGVKATFFMVGAKARRCPDVVRAVAAAGHDLGNHSDTHAQPWFQLPGGAYRGHLRANAAIAAAAGREPQFARAPWGFPNIGEWQAVRKLGQTYVHWSVHGYDWRRGITGAEIFQRVTSLAGPGDVVLLHDSPGYPGDPTAMIGVLPDLIEALQPRFRLVPLRHWLARPSQREAIPSEMDSLDLGSI